MSLKVVLITILVIFILPIISCINHCDNTTTPYFKIIDIVTYHTQYTGNDSEPWASVTENESVFWDQYYLRAAFEVDYHAYIKNSAGANLYAESCIGPGEGGSKTGIDTLYVVTLRDYNESYLANDTINDIILVNNTYYFSTVDPQPLSKYISDNKEGISLDYFEVKLKEESAKATGEYQFKLIYILEDQVQFEAISEKVILHK
ncbi:MAG: hypothetical protein ACNS60_18120 [Candidatus Cyclobacteriaceae bacterium M2_1C_046]